MPSGTSFYYVGNIVFDIFGITRKPIVKNLIGEADFLNMSVAQFAGALKRKTSEEAIIKWRRVLLVIARNTRGKKENYDILKAGQGNWDVKE